VRHANGYLKRKYMAVSRPLQRVAEDATRPPTSTGRRPRLVIAVVGETARAQNFQLNGYPRATNPVLSKRSDIIAFTSADEANSLAAAAPPP